MFLGINDVHHGRSEILTKSIQPESVALSLWSPPYFVGKNYESDATFDSWQNILRSVIHEHSAFLKPGGFMVINMADIRSFKDVSMPRFQSTNVAMRRSRVSVEDIQAAQSRFPDYNRVQLAKYLGCSEQTVDRRLHGNTIRGGKYTTQTRMHMVGGLLQSYALECGLYPYDRRIWVKDPAWSSSRWTMNTLKAVDEYEDIYIFWKPGPQTISRSQLSQDEWKEWGLRAVWSIRSVRRNDDHEAKFPLELASRIIRLYSHKGDTVLDLFMGSGTTGVACVMNGRSYIGIEKEIQYVTLARDNIRKAAIAYTHS